jgi:hypothetical protein
MMVQQWILIGREPGLAGLVGTLWRRPGDNSAPA